jgi:hypothetical protein
MRVIVYDCTDRPDLGYKSPTLRIIEDDGTMVLQGIVLSKNGRALAEKIAAGLGVSCEWIGPAGVQKQAPPPKVPKPAGTPQQSGLLFYLEPEELK